MTRLDRLRELLEEPLLVTTPVNVRYLTGFESTNAAVLVDEERTLLFTDYRYAEAARHVAEVEFIETERAIIRGLATHVPRRVGFERANLTYQSWETLRDAGIELVPRAALVERLRAVKDERELATMRTAAEITSEAYARFAREKFVGRTERELGFRFDQIQHELGSHASAFPTVVASGPNAAVPHHHSGDRVVQRRETVVVDAGAAIDGYVSDCTRTFATGDLPEELAAAYELCLEAQLRGLRAVRAGMSGRAADAEARDTISARGHGEHFGHGLGHGVGLLVHEAPVLRPESEDVLERGNVVTVEPGIYIPGAGGIRIEDLVVVRNGHGEVLTSFTKDLVTVE
jgi:Xaa-Pro aminopeptidase